MNTAPDAKCPTPGAIPRRKEAPIELPHAIILIDNPEKDIIEPIYASRENLKKIYDFNLNMGGGSIKGYLIEEGESLIRKLDGLLDEGIQIEKYGVDAGIQFAVGDGNHSIATAKVMWEELKKSLTEEERENHRLVCRDSNYRYNVCHYSRFGNYACCVCIRHFTS